MKALYLIDVCNRKHSQQSTIPPFCWGTTFNPTFWKRGSEKNRMPGGTLIVPATDICLMGGLLCFLSKKKHFVKLNMASRTQFKMLILTLFLALHIVLHLISVLYKCLYKTLEKVMFNLVIFKKKVNSF